jgi:hypothetical protein
VDRLGIEMLSVFGMPPLEFVDLAADLGCRYITTGMVGFAPVESLAYRPFSLRDDTRLRQDLLAAMDDRDVSISLGEGLLIAPGALTFVPTQPISTSWPNCGFRGSTPSAWSRTGPGHSTSWPP